MTSQRLRLLVAALLFLPAAPGSGLSQPQTTTDNIRLAALLGEDTRDAFAKNLQRRVVGGRTYSWQQYVDWGKKLIFN